MAVPTRPGPKRDLTREGIEPNPGPKNGARARKAGGGKKKPTQKMNIGGNVRKSSNKVSGRGGFFEDAGSSVGSFLGKKAGSLLSSIFGVGEYEVKSNTLLNANNPPLIVNSPSGTVIRHREYVADVLSTTTFTVTAYPINVGVATTFPWLAGVAQNFEQYELRGIIFEYKSLSGRALNSTNTALGTVIMATEYDSTKPPFTDKRSMENYTYSTSCDPGIDAMHPVECAGDVTPLRTMYVRNAGVVPSTDLRFSDMGLFQVATVGMQAAGFIAGELWVTYEVELLKPRLPPTISSNPPMHWTFDPPTFASAVGVPTSSVLFGSTIQKFTLRGVGASTVKLVTNSIQFSTTGTYAVVLVMAGNTNATIGNFVPIIASGSALGTGTFINQFFSDPSSSGDLTGTALYPVAGATSQIMISLVALNVTTATPTTPCTLTYPNVTIPGAIFGADLLITALPQGFTSKGTAPERDELFTMLDLLLKKQKLIEEDHTYIKVDEHKCPPPAA